MNRILIQILVAFFFFSAKGQVDQANQYATTITQQELKELLTIIASDALEGRDTGSRGQKMAAAFLEEEFKTIGLKPVVPHNNNFSYRQSFVLEKYEEEAIYLHIKDKRFSLSDNILYKGKLNMSEPISSEVMYLPASMINKIDKFKLKGKVALISLIGINKPDYKLMAQKVYEKGSEMVVFIPFESERKFREHKRSNGRNYVKKHLGFEQKTDTDIPKGYFLASPKIFKDLTITDQGINIDLLSSSVTPTMVNEFNRNNYQIKYYASSPSEKIESENILGYLEGSDKKDEVVVIMAHYDHVGKKGEYIYNGADDNGSGTTAVLEIAEAFAIAKKEGHGPKRSILFLLVSGEEKGLIGSNYYTSNPIIPLSETVTSLNLDMIGRYDADHDLDRNFVYLVGSDKLSSELHELSEKANNTFTHLNLDYSYNEKNHPTQIYYRSDHWSFAKYNIPVIFYFSGLHDDYHRPTDTVDKIEFDLLQKRSQLVFYTAWIVANRNDRLVVDKIKKVELQIKH
ncbi:MAG: M28 family peptidase [Bacteroidota bacterium]